MEAGDEDTSSIDVAKFSAHRVHNVLDRNVLPQAISRNLRAQLSNERQRHHHKYTIVGKGCHIR